MNLHLPIRVSIRLNGPEVPARRVVVTGFRRLCCRGSNRLLLAGQLSYLTLHGQGTVKVSLTWEAYSRLLEAMRREDVQLPDELVIASVLQRWGRRQVEMAFDAGRTLPMDGFVLAFDGGPCSSGPRRVLEECLLLDPAVSPDAA
jgi:hypothetical protein